MYKCFYCNKYLSRTPDLRKHIFVIHKKEKPYRKKRKIELYIAQLRYPGANILRLGKRYRDRLETVITLQNAGYRLESYLAAIKVTRSFKSDAALTPYIKPWMKTAKDMTDYMAEQLCFKFNACSPEVRFQGFLNRDISILKSKGHGDLVESVTALKVIKYVKKQMIKNIEELKEANSAKIIDDSAILPENASDSKPVADDSR